MPRPLASGVGVGRDHPARPVHVTRGRGEDLVGDGHLLGVDERLAVEAEVGRLAAGRREARVVVQVEVDAVQRGDAGGAGGEHAELQTGQQRKALAGGARVEILRQVRGAHDQRGRRAGWRRRSTRRSGFRAASPACTTPPAPSPGRRSSRPRSRPIRPWAGARRRRRPPRPPPGRRGPTACRGRSPGRRSRGARSHRRGPPPGPGPAPALSRPARRRLPGPARACRPAACAPCRVRARWSRA